MHKKQGPNINNPQNNRGNNKQCVNNKITSALECSIEVTGKGGTQMHIIGTKYST